MQVLLSSEEHFHEWKTELRLLYEFEEEPHPERADPQNNESDKEIESGSQLSGQRCSESLTLKKQGEGREIKG